MKKRVCIIILTVAVIAAVVIFGAVPLVQWMDTNAQEEAEYNELRDVVVHYPDRPEEMTQGSAADAEQKREPYLKVDFGALREINPDVVGWLCIPDTPVDYPVVQADDMRYLKRGFKGERNACGALFVLGETDFVTPQQNVTIFGHNMGRGRDVMFGSLLRYKDEAYFQAHEKLYFVTPFDEYGEYQVIAAFNTKATNDIPYTQTTFTDGEFAELIRAACDRGGQDVPQIEPDDKIITLSTCDRSYGGRNGRFVILATKSFHP